MLSTAQAKALGKEIRGFLDQEKPDRALARIKPYLQQRIPFAMLDHAGREIGLTPFHTLDEFLNAVAKGKSIGGWTIIGTALVQHLDDDLRGALERERQFTIQSDVWYATDAIAERVMGKALVDHFDAALSVLGKWRADENRWVRRSIGVGAHVWAKRMRGSESEKASRLLKFLEPLWEEREIDAVKGIGWGLKTLGRYYPEPARVWLNEQEARPHRALMMSKATTYLSGVKRTRA